MSVSEVLGMVDAKISFKAIFFLRAHLSQNPTFVHTSPR